MSTDFQSGPDDAPGLPSLHVVLAACALVATGHLLGAAWLSESVGGLPAGLWLIGLTALAFSRAARRRVAAVVEAAWNAAEPGAAARPERSALVPNAPGFGWWPRAGFAGACVDALTRLAAVTSHVAFLRLWAAEFGPVGETRERVERWLASIPWPTRPLRIGLHLPADEADALIGSAGSCRTQWFRLASWDDPQSACRRNLFDAVVYHDGEGPVRIVTLERPGRRASVVEWADLQQELTFGALFPARIDPAAVVVEGASRGRVREGADLLRALLEAAAILARAEHRLTLADRLLGRRPSDAVERPGGLSLWRSTRSRSASVIAGLGAAAARHAETWPEASRLARQAAGAYFVGHPGLEPADRLDGLRATGAAATDAATALRLGAACIGALEDEEGLGWLVQADALLRRGASPLAPLDHAAFLESELVHGSDDPMSVGRAAAGICMVCAATPADRIAFVRDDMLEEMAYAGWLVGRDQDRGLLIAVFLEIEHAHAATASGKLAHHRRSRDKSRRARTAA